MKGLQKKVIVLVMFLLMLQPLFIIFSKRETFFSSNYWVSYPKYRFNYENSQYVKKSNPTIITDEDFESYAGGAFLNGLNPILITHDHPPLGKYIVSFSILLFNNQHTIVIPFFIFSLVGIYLISKKILKKTIFSLIPIVLLLNEPLILGKLQYSPIPELFQFTFIIYSIYFFMCALSSKRYGSFFILTSIMLGGVIATRVFALGAVLVFSFNLYLVIFDRKKLFNFIVTLPISLFVLILSYARTIYLGASIFDVFGIQKYILAYHQSKFILPFSFWDLLLFNRWHTWWDGNKIISDVNWVILWPISFLLTVAQPISKLKDKITISNHEWLLLLWLGLYMAFLSVGYTSTRYFLPIIPFMYILAISGLIKFFTYKR